MPEKTKDPRAENEILLIALLLKVGGHSLNDGEVERAKTHSLVVSRVDEQTVLGAEPNAA
jgi:hypothetical protein